MKRVLSFPILFLIVMTSFAKDVVIDGVKYTLHGSGNLGKVSIKADNKKNMPADLIIPELVVIDGREYPVTEIEKEGFWGCKNLRTVVLPNTITKISQSAFRNCTSLISAVMPDNAKIEVDKGNYGFGSVGIFKGCTALESIRGTNIPYPEEVVYEAIFNCEDVPFYKYVQEIGALTLTKQDKVKSFKDFAIEKVKEPIEEWQKRKDYETVAQWETRVNDVNRKKMIEEYMAEARNEFISQNAPSKLLGTLEPYNSEYGFFSVSTPNFGNLYVDVPENESENFKNNWNKVEIKPVYGILDGELNILDCKFVLDDKVYNSSRSYDEDELSEVVLDITPLAALREYEQMMSSNNQNVKTAIKRFDPDVVDIEIPTTTENNSNTFVVIIGNENYERVAPVEYAMNDARIFAKYCNRTLGIPEKNIRTYYDCSLVNLREAIKDISLISDAYNGDIKVIFYYAGHGIPDEKTRNSYLLPIDAAGNNVQDCYPIDQLYEELGKLNAKSVVAFIDACFSGSLRGEGMLASARGIKLKPKDYPADGNLVIVSAASGDETANPYPEKSHGLFSYYLLKKLSDSNGDATLGELSDFLKEEVLKHSLVEIKKSQTPNVKFSDNMTDTWRNIKLK